MTSASYKFDRDIKHWPWTLWFVSIIFTVLKLVNWS